VTLAIIHWLTTVPVCGSGVPGKPIVRHRGQLCYVSAVAPCRLPASFGLKTGNPEQGIDDTFALYTGLNLIADGFSPYHRKQTQKYETRDIHTSKI
jgi:hypothetical protein